MNTWVHSKFLFWIFLLCLDLACWNCLMFSPCFFFFFSSYFLSPPVLPNLLLICKWFSYLCHWSELSQALYQAATEYSPPKYPLGLHTKQNCIHYLFLLQTYAFFFFPCVSCLSHCSLIPLDYWNHSVFLNSHIQVLLRFLYP